MPLDPALVLSLAALGLASGFLAGLLGIGGGMLMTPFITALLSARGIEPGVAIKVGVATSMATIIFTAISSVRAHHQKGGVRWDIVWRLAPGIALGGLASSLGVFSLLKGALLYFVFAAFVSFSAWQTLLGKKPAAARQLPGTAGMLGAGGGIGFLSGLVGAGGGFVSVPFMTWCNVAMHNAVATSAALGLPTALFSVIGYVAAGQNVAGLPPQSLGYVWLPGLLVLATCSVLMAPLGARTAHALPVAKLKQAFAVVLLGLAVYMLTKGVGAL